MAATLTLSRAEETLAETCEWLRTTGRTERVNDFDTAGFGI